MTASSTFRKGSFWFAVAAVLLLGGLAAGVMLSARPAAAPATALSSPRQSATANPAPASPVADDVVAAPVASVTPYTCTSSSLTAAGAPPVATVDALRVGAHPGYDRFVLQFSSAQPGRVDVRTQPTAAFTGSPRGDVIRLAGTRGIALTVRGADMHTAYSGVRDVKTSYAGLAEARVIEDFEGQVTVGLGVRGAGCYRAFVLTSPVRLVVDIQTA